MPVTSIPLVPGVAGDRRGVLIALTDAGRDLVHEQVAFERIEERTRP